MKTLSWNWKRWPFAVLGMLLGAAPALAHEKWFTDEHTRYFPKPEIFSAVTPFGLAVVLLATAVFVGFWFYERKYQVTRHPKFARRHLSDVHLHTKAMLAVTVGTLLMASGLQGMYMAPNLILPETGFGQFLALFQIALGSLMVFLSPLIAELGIALAALFLLGFFAIPVQGMLEELLVLGVAVFFITSETARLPWKRWITPERERLGYHALRVLVGLNFLVLSGVKWFRPDLAMELVESHGLNFMAWAGFTSAHFIFCAAVVETFVALAILFKIAMRPALVLAFATFMTTIFIFGFGELLGHLPIKAALVVLFLLGDWKKGETRIIH